MMTQQKYLLLTAALLAIAISSVAAPQPPAPQKQPRRQSSGSIPERPGPVQRALRRGRRKAVAPRCGPTEAACGWAAPGAGFHSRGRLVRGSKSSGIPRLALLVASGNYIGFSVEYRLTSAAIWPAQIYDCKAAIRWVRANAQKYGVDPNKVGVWGGSAGGHLVSSAGHFRRCQRPGGCHRLLRSIQPR